MRLFYKKSGSGDPMVILHGLYGSSDNWSAIGRELEKHFTIYLVDLRNHGRSPHDDRHSYELIREDLLLFMENAGLGKALFLGHSMGGKAAMCFAGHYPEKVEKLIVADIAPKSYKNLYRREALSHDTILQAMNSIDLSSVSSRRDIDSLLSHSISSKRIRGFLMKNLKPAEDRKYRWALNLDVLIRELDNIMDGVNADCFDPDNPVEGIPALFIRGADSPYITDNDVGLILKIFPSARLETIPDAGHWLHAEQPAAFVDAVKNFAL